MISEKYSRLGKEKKILKNYKNYSVVDGYNYIHGAKDEISSTFKVSYTVTYKVACNRGTHIRPLLGCSL